MQHRTFIHFAAYICIHTSLYVHGLMLFAFGSNNMELSAIKPRTLNYISYHLKLNSIKPKQLVMPHFVLFATGTV